MRVVEFCLNYELDCGTVFAYKYHQDMRNVRGLFVCLLALGGFSADGGLFTYTFQPSNGLIPNDWNASSGPTPWTDTRVVNVGAGYSITDVNVSFTVTGTQPDGSGGRNGDLYAKLSYQPSGDSTTYYAILLNRVGITEEPENIEGYTESRFSSVTLDDSGPHDIHLYKTYSGYTGGDPTGTYKPDGRDLSPDEVWDTTARSQLLNVFNNRSANGTWTLTFSDWNNNDYQSKVVSWSLEIQAVPEPVTTALMILGGVFGSFQFVRYIRRRKAPAV